MATTVWFDTEGTLIEHDQTFQQLFELVIPDASVDASNQFREAFVQSIDRCDPDPYLKAFRDAPVADGTDTEPEELATEYVNAKIAATVIPPEVKTVLRELTEHCQVGIITNGVEDVHRRILSQHNVDDLIDVLIVSTEEKLAKPNPDLFRLAKEFVSSTDHVYVGDNYEEDIVPARTAGFDTVHVRNDGGPSVSVDALDSLRLLTLLSD